jgi:hypothetical protein
MAEIKKPFGVLVLVVVYLILAIIRFAEAIFVGGTVGTGTSALLFCLAPSVLFGIFYALISVGLYMLKRWGWILAMVFAVLGVILALLKLVGVGIGLSIIEDIDVASTFIAIPLISLVLNLVVMIVLLKNRDQFE